jgi:hypothetical protein
MQRSKEKKDKIQITVDTILHFERLSNNNLSNNVDELGGNEFLLHKCHPSYFSCCTCTTQ